MKRIDLVCKLTSPLVFAGLLAQLDAGYCSLAMATWCLFSFVAELWLVRRVWYSSRMLSAPRSDVFYHGDPRKTTISPLSRILEDHGGEARQQDRRGPMFLLRVFQSFREYRHHAVFLGNLKGWPSMLIVLFKVSNLHCTGSIHVVCYHLHQHDEVGNSSNCGLLVGKASAR